MGCNNEINDTSPSYFCFRTPVLSFLWTVEKCGWFYVRPARSGCSHPIGRSCVRVRALRFSHRSWPDRATVECWWTVNLSNWSMLQLWRQYIFPYGCCSALVPPAPNSCFSTRASYYCNGTSERRYFRCLSPHRWHTWHSGGCFGRNTRW